MKAFVLVQRVARAVGDAIHRQHHRQVFFGHRHGTMLVAVNDGNRRTPITLAAHAPVAQAPGSFLLAQAQGGKVGGHRIDAGLEAQAVVLAGVDGHALVLVAIPVGPGVQTVGLGLDIGNLLDRQAVFFRELKIALVMRRHSHDGAVAIAHQHVVANPDLNLRAGQRMRDKQARGRALFLLRGQLGLGGAAGLAFGDEGGQRGMARRCLHSQRMLGRHGAKGHAHDGVGARGEDVHPAVANQRARAILDVMRERKAHAFALADPVFLHQPHALGPSGQLVLHAVEQLFGVVGDLEVVARNLALFNRGAGAPALAVNHLLVGQHGLVDRVPVHHLGLAVGNAFFQHFQEQPLVPLVVAGVAGGNLPAPVHGQSQRLHLLFHVGDVVVRPLCGRHAVFQRGIFGRQAKSVPAHGHQDVVALHAQLTRQHVVDGVVAHMAHVQLAAGVRQHGASVVFFAAGVFADAVGVKGVPVALRAALYVEGAVFVLHEKSGYRKTTLKRGPGSASLKTADFRGWLWHQG